MKNILLLFIAIILSANTYAQSLRYGYCKTTVMGTGEKKGIYISDVFKFPAGEGTEAGYRTEVAQKWRQRLMQVLGSDYPQYGAVLEVTIINADCGGDRYFTSYADAETGRDCLIKRIKNSAYPLNNKYFKILFRFDY